MFQKARDMYKLQKDASAAKKKLDNIHIEAEVRGVTVVISGQQKAISINVQDEALLTNKGKLESALLEAFNKALEKSQKVAAEEMKEVMGSMGLL